MHMLPSPYMTVVSAAQQTRMQVRALHERKFHTNTQPLQSRRWGDSGKGRAPAIKVAMQQDWIFDDLVRKSCEYIKICQVKSKLVSCQPGCS